MIFFDTETCGFHGPIVTLQYAENDGPIRIHNVWTSPIEETLELLDKLINCQEGIVGFNLAFDWFHVCQTYTTLIQFQDQSILPVEQIDQYAIYEEKGRMGPCLKPFSCLDLLLHARKGPYQNTMARDDIEIKKIPTPLAWELAKELDKRIPLNNIYFAARKDSSIRWQVMDIHDDFGDVIPEFKNLVLKFAPSRALKALAEDAGIAKQDDILLFTKIDPPDWTKPNELGYAPFALAIGKPGDWNKAWPMMIEYHINHWQYNSIARQYATDDVKYTRALYDYFKQPPMNDVDSILACMVGTVRWRGFALDIQKLSDLKEKAQGLIDNKTINLNSTAVCRKYLEQVMGETEKLILRQDGDITTKAVILEEISKWKESTICTQCQGSGCADCKAEGIIETNTYHPAAIRAKEILDFRHAKKEIENYDKLLTAGRFHASLKIIGTKSSRMSGDDGLNAQGIKKSKEVRSCFPLADGGMILSGGDFARLEVVLMAKAYDDPDLYADLMSGKNFHALFGTFLFPGKSHDDILATKGLAGEQNLYGRSKNGVFALAYGGEAFTLKNRVGIDIEAAEISFQNFITKYKKWGEARRKVFDEFCSMRQPGGIGTKVEWHQPSNYVESLFGFKRYFTLENKICEELFKLADDPPKEWTKLKLKVVRRDRLQTASGAIKSACFAAAFALQAANMRAAGNHKIQSTGAELTKILQVRVWEVQPSGIGRWRVQPLNIHDEIMCPMMPEYNLQVEQIVKDFITEYGQKIPLLEMEWKKNIESWGDK